jgi:hypothetical protein
VDGAEGDEIGRLDLLRIGRQRRSLRSPDDEGGDSESGAGLEVVEVPEEVLGTDLEPDFLSQLTERGSRGGLGGLDAAAGESPLTPDVRRVRMNAASSSAAPTMTQATAAGVRPGVAASLLGNRSRSA